MMVSFSRNSAEIEPKLIRTRASISFPGFIAVSEPTGQKSQRILEKIGLDESEWRDDPASLADWEAWVKAIQPLELTQEEEAFFARYQKLVADEILTKVI
jgi:hypothetical protein